MDVPRTRLKEMILEELSKKDKAEIKKMVTKELDSALNKAVKEELEKVLKSKDIKNDIGAITKDVLKKLYKDLSFQHPYIIDRIKV
jgi:predicted lipid-binding transport protein (Tim44 family)